ncbi:MULTISPECIES: arsenate reductase (glutaredoxin) [Neisseria]|uniref:Arsenate reductase n=1 Tax=Neisseria dumasiana TaxID=1931275 RepID=A0A1X3DKU6_9NEIS|nr:MULTISPECIES: arsenate reductase (glutaredoxin) [Neisseria]KPN73123.1 arsenate reductase [Neisseria sp. 74A18]OSI14644.1 arsenate reductase (glutaredoxin) [Neisseria dumasiana]OSI23588.1 arsenate reductase (glutaredoxin) [Neisseria dumasiana]OSI35075.1 arsenate reductase (glutaredoxin) [Neisseria dumasiana]UOO84429.1 arsenate reductase (glutaredoxin) [Neisseria dumasiana]
MQEAVTLYHNNRCSKSRAALALLQVRGLKTKVVNYLDTPPTFEELKNIFNQLGAESPRSMMRVKDALYQELNLNHPDLSHDELLQAIADHPALLERPIAVVGNRAAVGRPLENIEALL